MRRYTTKHRARTGVTFAASRWLTFRDATAPATSRQITEAWMLARGLNADDQTFVIIRKRIGACPTALRVDGLAVGADMLDAYKRWVLA